MNEVITWCMGELQKTGRDLEICKDQIKQLTEEIARLELRKLNFENALRRLKERA